MKLIDLLKETTVLKTVGWIKDLEILDIAISSRKVKKGSLFIAQKGLNFDGTVFVEEAIINGAVAIICEKELPAFNIPQIIVRNTRIATATLASTFFGNPKNLLKFVGVTGTNGKTSCAEFLSTIITKTLAPCGYIGTTGAKLGEKTYPSFLTTPDPLVFHKLLKDFVNDGAKYVAMEVSAHAIDLEKVCNITFEVGILTNITQDHLDYFKTMKRYSQTKTKWILSENVKTKIVNSDDKFCQKLITNSREDILSFGLDNPADVFAVNIENNPVGTNFVLNLLDNVDTYHTNLVGMFNVYNVMAVATAACVLGIDLTSIKSAISGLTAPSGRFNIIRLQNNKTIIVDFAHTPDGLEKALKSAKSITTGKLIALFGCGGDRDKLKRPIMGKIAEENSDFCILTSDNPRFEKPENILNDIEKGISGHNYLKIADRKLAIYKLVEMMCPGDVAVVCGKGGEKYQDINGIKLPYDDFEEIKKSVKTILGEDFKAENKEILC